jgi:hypothetical protein
MGQYPLELEYDDPSEMASQARDVAVDVEPLSRFCSFQLLLPSRTLLRQPTVKIMNNSIKIY